MLVGNPDSIDPPCLFVFKSVGDTLPWGRPHGQGRRDVALFVPIIPRNLTSLTFMIFDPGGFNFSNKLHSPSYIETGHIRNFLIVDSIVSRFKISETEIYSLRSKNPWHSLSDLLLKASLTVRYSPRWFLYRAILDCWTPMGFSILNPDLLAIV
jgi:hypothetical protein